MHSTQLACPHCGSTLNFGVDVAAGTPLECLICMKTFIAENPVSVGAAGPTVSVEPAGPRTLCPEAPSTMSDVSASPGINAPPASEPIGAAIPKVAAPAALPASSIRRAAKGEVLVSKPYSAPLASGIAEQPTQAPVQSFVPPASSSAEAPSIRRSEESAAGGTILLIAAGVGLLFLLTGGIILAAWRLTTLSRTGPDDVQMVGSAKAKDSGPKPEGQDWQAEQPGKKDDGGSGAAPTPKGDAKLDVRQTLKRKNAAKPDDNGSEPEIPIITLGNQPISGLDQQKINAAIDKGIKYLRRTQNAAGTWSNGHGVGHAALGGLTLLECGAPKKDLDVQRAVAYVRAHSAKLTATYELSLAILFLDRLGYQRDRPLIQGMAMRLLAGQNDGGGWTYQCKELNPQEMFQLYTFLQSHKQPNLLNPLGADNLKTQAGIVVNPKRDPALLNNPFLQMNDLILSEAIAGANADPKTTPKKDNVVAPVNPDPKGRPKDKAVKPALKPIRPETLLPNLRGLPIVKNQGLKKTSTKFGRGNGGDNSNTQFAMLALWAARRHGVPTDQALLASYHRFMNPQNADGGWGYTPRAQTTNTMTNVGLLGLAMGHGAAPEIIHFNPKNPKDIVVKPALEDPSIQKGLKALSRYIGVPSRDPKKTQFNPENLYFLWTVERVAVLYDLKTIGGKDWYGWGAQILVHTQAADGDWPVSFYPGQSPPLNTCFALLFLRRSNLVQDLTDNLRLNTGIADPEK